MWGFLTKINKKILNKILLGIIIFCFTLVLILVISVRFFVSYSFIENFLNEKTGLKIEFVKPQTNFDYRFNLVFKADGVNVYNQNKTSQFASIKNPHISLKPFGFLFKRAYFKCVCADKVILKVKRDKNGKIDIVNELNKDLSSFFNRKIILTRLNTNIKDIDFVFEDEYKIKSSIYSKLKDTKIDLSKRKNRFTFSQTGIIQTNINNQKQTANLALNINTKYPLKGLKDDDINLEIDLDNVNLFIFNDLMKEYVSKDISQFNGLAHLNIKTDVDGKQNVDLKINNPTLKLIDNKIISPYKEGLSINSIFDLKEGNIEISKFEILAKNLLILSDGCIKNIFSKKPNLDLNVELKNTQINNLIPFIPDNAIFYRPKGIPTLKKANFFGLANGKINIKYPLDVTGSLKIENVHIPTIVKSYKQNDVNIRFMKDKMRIYTRVYTPDNEYVLVDGISNLDNSLYGKYRIKSTPRINLAFAQKYLVPIQQIIGFNIGPVPIMDISGYGNIDINTQGTLEDAQIFGTFNAFDASAVLEGLDAKLINGNCKLVFDDRELIFKEIKGKIADSEFILTGKGNTKGEVKLNAKIKDAKTSQILKIFNNSVISQPYQKITKQVAAASGKISADINLSGVIKDYENKEFLSTLKPSGSVTLKDNKIILNNGLGVQKLSGILDFGLVQKGNFTFNLGDSNFNIQMNSNDNLDKISKNEIFNIETELFSNKIAFKDVVDAFDDTKFIDSMAQKTLNEIKNFNFFSKLYLKGQGNIKLNDIDLNKIKFNGYLIGLNDSQIKDIKFNSGIIKIQNNKVNFDNFATSFKGGLITAKGNVFNVFSKNPFGDLIINLKDIQLDNLDKIIPKIKAKTAFINSGQILFRNDDLKLNSMSIDYDSMPIFLNVSFKDIYSSKIFDGNFSTVINEKTSDIIINPYLITPIKIIGEVPLKGSIKGNIDNYFLDFSAIVPKGSDVSYFGSNLGDINHKREIDGRIDVAENVAKIHNFRLIKYISNQNNKVNPIVALRANGQVVQKKDSIVYDNFKVATNSPINVRILNIIFKKSLLKKGNFDCNITLNGDVKLPKINGKINLYDLDIPLYNTKIDNIKFLVSDKFIDGEILAKNKQSDVKINLHALNKLEPPYVIKDVVVLSKKIDIDEILSSVQSYDVKTDITPKAEYNINPDDIIIENGSFDFKELQYDKILAQNLKGRLTYKNSLINLKNANLDIADGKIQAQGNYNLKTTKLEMLASMFGCDSNILAVEFLNLPNQIFGKMDGVIELSAKNLNTPQGIKKVKSQIKFSINNGKMPKLGSLEYILRAGNLFKNGLMGLSLNNLIEVLTPYKTGEFEKISGEMEINNAEIERLNILSQGKNLSLYLDGNYSILENFADINMYGKLSQNISNALGALGNASISQFIEAIVPYNKNKNEKDIELQKSLDKIPPIEAENQGPRYFRARVLGDINKDNYMKSFNWI